MKKMKQIFDDAPSLDFETMSFESTLKNSKSMHFSPIELPDDEQLDMRSDVQKNIQNLEEEQKTSAEMEALYHDKINKTWGILERWRDKSMYEQVQKVKQEMFQLTAKHRLTMYDLLLQSRIQQTKEKYDSGLKMIKSHYRRHVSSYVMYQMERLTEEVKGYEFRFMELMKSKHQYAETLKHIPSLYERYMKSLFMQEERYIQFLDKIMDKFDGVMSEELSMYRHT